ncbi:MAG: DUF1871 family protein [Prevotella sp.]|nr:DUF1871 family protein [Staphylococcus sp.]MCM1350698.1 DUF1871 family protein [Prevotella sp.]
MGEKEIMTNEYNLLLSKEEEIENFTQILETFTKVNDYVIIFRLISPIYTYKSVKKNYGNFNFLYFDKRKFKSKLPELFVLLNNECELNIILDDWPCFTIEKKFLYFIKKENFQIDKFNNLEIYNILEKSENIDMIIENSENSDFYYDLIINIKNSNYNPIKIFKISQIINEWDPIKVLIHTPMDEYNDETFEISNKYVNDVNELSKIIHNVFKMNFGETFNYSLQDCYMIAEKIINNIQNI